MQNDNKINLAEIHIPIDLKEHIPGFLKSRMDSLGQISAFLRESNYAQLANLAHQIKGYGKPYGFPKISQYGLEIETFAKTKKTEELKLKIDEYSNYINLLWENQKDFI